jgi:hypothetical protein
VRISHYADRLVGPENHARRAVWGELRTPYHRTCRTPQRKSDRRVPALFTRMDGRGGDPPRVLHHSPHVFNSFAQRGRREAAALGERSGDRNRRRVAHNQPCLELKVRCLESLLLE